MICQLSVLSRRARHLSKHLKLNDVTDTLRDKADNVGLTGCICQMFNAELRFTGSIDTKVRNFFTLPDWKKLRRVKSS